MAKRSAEALGSDLPDGLARRLADQYGEDSLALIRQGFAEHRPVTLRANALKADAAAIAEQLDAAGIAWGRPPARALESTAFVVRGAREDAVRALAAYDEGALYLQSLSAMLPALALAPAAGENILDMAAAPGGKTCQMAALSGGAALICACEKNHVRAERLRHNLAKQGAARVNVMECDARKLDDFFSFDKVLLDAPCSGSGTVSLAGGAYRGGFSDELLARSVKAQRALLRKALDVLKPGGTLVYATCSILADENERMVESVLDEWNGRAAKARRKAGASPSSRAEAELAPLPANLMEGVPALPCRLPEAAVVRPTELFEGFFLARIEKGRA